MTQRYLRTSAGTPMSTPDAYMCRRRALHVFTETQRVFDFYAVCSDAAQGKMDNVAALKVRCCVVFFSFVKHNLTSELFGTASW